VTALVLQQPVLATLGNVDVEHIEAVDRAGRHSDQFTGIAPEQVRDLIALADCVLEAVRTRGRLVGPARENVKAR
jgi:hypothetical protein